MIQVYKDQVLVKNDALSTTYNASTLGEAFLAAGASQAAAAWKQVMMMSGTLMKAWILGAQWDVDDDELYLEAGDDDEL